MRDDFFKVKGQHAQVLSLFFFFFFFFPHVGSHRHGVVCISFFQFFGWGFCFLYFPCWLKSWQEDDSSNRTQPSWMRSEKCTLRGARRDDEPLLLSVDSWGTEKSRGHHTHTEAGPRKGPLQTHTHTHTHTATHTRNLKSPRKTRQTVENGLPSFLVVCSALRYVTYFFLRFVFAWQFLNIDRASRRDDGDILNNSPTHEPMD
jgi:hypothetical protein